MTTWSFSALKQYEGCARQYHEMRVLKNYPYEETEQALYGNQLHEAAENFVNKKTPLPPQFAFMQPVIDALLSKEGTKIAECEMCLTAELKPCKWNAKNVWLRGLADLLILDSDGVTAWVCDWKTGNSKYADKEQLDVMSLLVFAHYPHIQQVNSALVFVVKDVFIKHKRKREEVDKLWWIYRMRVAKIEKAHTTGVWNPTQSGLCRKYCSVLSCEHCGRS